MKQVSQTGKALLKLSKISPMGVSRKANTSLSGVNVFPKTLDSDSSYTIKIGKPNLNQLVADRKMRFSCFRWDCILTQGF